MINLGLTRITKLVASTSIPWKAVHIAGTNGKGSVANFIASILHESGLSVGRFNSPHLIDRWDCITINQRAVPKSAFIGVEKYVKARNACEKIDASEFELLTATAFEIFTRAEVDIGVIECGLGGRLDATNVLKPDQVLCSVFTKIGMDHEALLGDTVFKIAREKAGIMKQGVPFVVDQSNQLEVLMTLDEYAKEAGATQGSFLLPAILNGQISLSSGDVVRRRGFDIKVVREKPGEIQIDERGSATAVNASEWSDYQQQNLKTALLACHTLQNSTRAVQQLGKLSQILRPDNSLDPNQIAAIAASRLDWAGRMQLLDTSKITGDKKAMLLDGAHNRQAAQSLGRYVDSKYRPHGSVVWVIAMSRGKNVSDYVSALFREGDRVVVTQFGPVDGMPWVQSEGLTELAQAVRATIRTDVHMEQEPWYALRRAAEVASGESEVVICGSLYLVGDVLRMLHRELPTELEGAKWDAWVERQRRELESRRQGNFG